MPEHSRVPQTLLQRQAGVSRPQQWSHKLSASWCTTDPEPVVSLHLAPQDGRHPAGGSGCLDQALDVSDEGTPQAGGADGGEGGQQGYKER
jgi:hypothetical protein